MVFHDKTPGEIGRPFLPKFIDMNEFLAKKERTMFEKGLFPRTNTPSEIIGEPTSDYGYWFLVNTHRGITFRHVKIHYMK